MERGVDIDSIDTRGPTLEDVFLALTGGDRAAARPADARR
jgi:hypothetical protein